MPFRTTISAIVWTESAAEASALVDSVKAALPDDEARGSVLSAVEERERPEIPAVTPDAEPQPETEP